MNLNKINFKKTNFDLLVEKILLEMPQMLKSEVGFIDSEKSNNIHVDYVKKYWKEIDERIIGGHKVRIYLSDKEGVDFAIAFIDKNDYYIGLIEFDKFEENSIQMVYIWQRKNFKNFILNVFLEYLLPNYNSIFSDQQQTILGFNFYNKLRFFLPEQYNFSIFDLKDKKEISLEKEDSLEKYFNEEDNFQRYVFKISKK